MYRNTVVTWGRELVKQGNALVLVKFDVKTWLSNGNVQGGSWKSLTELKERTGWNYYKWTVWIRSERWGHISFEWKSQRNKPKGMTAKHCTNPVSDWKMKKRTR